LKQEIKNYFLIEKGLDIDRSLKYIDPTYMIRTVPANCYDRKMCADLASSAVHGTMAGFTGFTVGNINQHVAMIPISSLGQKPNCIEKQSQAWQRLLSYTDQPSFQNEESEGLE
jgi:6-phosphofructokinase 1